MLHNPLKPLSKLTRRPLALAVAMVLSGSATAVHFDSTDLRTMYQDSVGTTPVYQPGQGQVDPPVGLWLDKSQRMAQGAELVVNGDFGDGVTGWSSDASALLSVGSGVLRVASTGTPNAGCVQVVSGLVAGKTYRLTLSLVSLSNPATYVYINGSGGLSGQGGFNQVGEYIFFFTATGTTYTASFRFAGISEISGDYFEIDDVSVREIKGNHAYQTTSTARPKLSGRYNLLTATEDFGDAAWEKRNGAVIVSNATTAPNGTLTADKLIPASGAIGGIGSGHSNIYGTAVSFVSGTSYVFRMYAKAAELNQVSIYLDPAGATLLTVDLTNGDIVANTGGIAGAVADVGDGWYLLEITDVSQSTAMVNVLRIAAVTPSGDGTSGIYIWGADLRVANDGVGLPTYQRVVDANTYDTNGFPLYLSFDGVDDFLVTPSIDFTGTDKVTVWAGQRMLSSGGGMLLEISDNTGTNQGSFYLLAATDIVLGYNYAARGTDGLSAARVATQAQTPPHSAVLTCVGNISTDYLCRLRVNSVLGTDATDTVGGGNYGNYPLYIGRRGGTDYPFNGRLYQLIIRGAQSTDQEIAAVERYINQRARIY